MDNLFLVEFNVLIEEEGQKDLTLQMLMIILKK